MANFKRRKRRNQVKCNICTDARQQGNSLRTGDWGNHPTVILNKIKHRLAEKEQLHDLKTA